MTSRLRSYLYRDFFQKDTPPSSNSAQGLIGSSVGAEVASPNIKSSAQDGQSAADPVAAQPSKVIIDNLRMYLVALIFFGR